MRSRSHRRARPFHLTAFNLTVSALLAMLSSCSTPSIAHEQPILIHPRTLTIGNGLTAPIGRPTRGYLDYASPPTTDLVQLWARDSFYVGKAALHPAFLIYDQVRGEWQQWEIWAGDLFGYYCNQQQSTRRYSDGRADESVTFRHRQVGAIRNWSVMTFFDESEFDALLGEWAGAEARRVIDVLQRPETFPEHNHYLIWPGPNSNGYARWVLAEAGVGLDLDPKMVGKDWYSPLGLGIGLTPTRTGLHVDCLTFGVALGLQDGVELHLLGMTWGIDLWPPALKTPFGRVGYSE